MLPFGSAITTLLYLQHHDDCFGTAVSSHLVAFNNIGLACALFHHSAVKT